MKNPTPTKGSRAFSVAPASITLPILTTYRAQLIASRFALPIETAAIIAGLVFMGGAHG